MSKCEAGKSVKILDDRRRSLGSGNIRWIDTIKRIKTIKDPGKRRYRRKDKTVQRVNTATNTQHIKPHMQRMTVLPLESTKNTDGHHSTEFFAHLKTVPSRSPKCTKKVFHKGTERLIGIKNNNNQADGRNIIAKETRRGQIVIQQKVRKIVPKDDLPKYDVDVCNQNRTKGIEPKIMTTKEGINDEKTVVQIITPRQKEKNNVIIRKPKHIKISKKSSLTAKPPVPKTGKNNDKHFVDKIDVDAFYIATKLRRGSYQSDAILKELKKKEHTVQRRELFEPEWEEFPLRHDQERKKSTPSMTKEYKHSNSEHISAVIMENVNLPNHAVNYSGREKRKHTRSSKKRSSSSIAVSPDDSCSLQIKTLNATTKKTRGIEIIDSKSESSTKESLAISMGTESSKTENHTQTCPNESSYASPYSTSDTATGTLNNRSFLSSENNTRPIKKRLDFQADRIYENINTGNKQPQKIAESSKMTMSDKTISCGINEEESHESQDSKTSQNDLEEEFKLEMFDIQSNETNSVKLDNSSDRDIKEDQHILNENVGLGFPLIDTLNKDENTLQPWNNMFKVKSIRETHILKMLNPSSSSSESCSRSSRMNTEPLQSEMLEKSFDETVTTENENSDTYKINSPVYDIKMCNSEIDNDFRLPVGRRKQSIANWIDSNHKQNPDSLANDSNVAKENTSRETPSTKTKPSSTLCYENSRSVSNFEDFKNENQPTDVISVDNTSSEMCIESDSNIKSSYKNDSICSTVLPPTPHNTFAETDDSILSQATPQRILSEQSTSVYSPSLDLTAEVMSNNENSYEDTQSLFTVEKLKFDADPTFISFDSTKLNNELHDSNSFNSRAWNENSFVSGTVDQAELHDSVQYVNENVESETISTCESTLDPKARFHLFGHLTPPPVPIKQAFSTHRTLSGTILQFLTKIRSKTAMSRQLPHRTKVIRVRTVTEPTLILKSCLNETNTRPSTVPKNHVLKFDYAPNKSTNISIKQTNLKDTSTNVLSCSNITGSKCEIKPENCSDLDPAESSNSRAVPPESQSDLFRISTTSSWNVENKSYSPVVAQQKNNSSTPESHTPDIHEHSNIVLLEIEDEENTYNQEHSDRGSNDLIINRSFCKGCWHYDKDIPWYMWSGKGIGWKILLAPLLLVVGPIVWIFCLFKLNERTSTCCKTCWRWDTSEYWFSCKGKGSGWIFIFIPFYILLGPVVIIFTVLTVILLACCGDSAKNKSPSKSKAVVQNTAGISPSYMQQCGTVRGINVTGARTQRSVT